MKFILLLISFTLISCTSEKSLKKMLKENPDILTEAIESNPDAFIESLNKAVKLAQKTQAKRRQEQEKKQLEGAFDSPLKPIIRNDELIRGNKKGPIILVEYSDFECPFCGRSYKTVLELLKKYKGRVKFIYKHLPLSFHPQAMIASQYYEAIRLQNEEKSIKFHDAIYENQRKLSNGEKYLKKLAKSLKVNMGKLAKDIKSKKVQDRIKADMEEASKFGIQGTPGFILNGVPIKGAYPISHFEDIIKELEKRNKIKL